MCHINIRKIQKDKIIEENYNSKATNGLSSGLRRESTILPTVEKSKMAANANYSHYNNVIKADLSSQNETQSIEKVTPSLFVQSSKFPKTDISSIKRSKYNSKINEPVKIDGVELRKYDSLELSGI